ncbi:unnamed protein product [Choristocarpus tenellus]
MSDRLSMFLKIDARCEDMLSKGLPREVADLLVDGHLRPETPAGRSIGYRQVIDYLCGEGPTAFVENVSGGGSRGWSGVTQPFASAGAKVGGDSQISGKADKKTLDDCHSRSGGGVRTDTTAAEARFHELFLAFAAKTRKYATDQMKWYRSERGKIFSWEAWDLGLGSKLSDDEDAKGDLGASAKNGKARYRQHRKQLDAQRDDQPSTHKCGDGRGMSDVVESIAWKVELSPEDFQIHLDGEDQVKLRRENLKRGKAMKTYVCRVSSSLASPGALRRMGLEGEAMAERVQVASGASIAPSAVGVGEGLGQEVSGAVVAELGGGTSPTGGEEGKSSASMGRQKGLRW